MLVGVRLQSVVCGPNSRIMNVNTRASLKLEESGLGVFRGHPRGEVRAPQPQSCPGEGSCKGSMKGSSKSSIGT